MLGGKKGGQEVSEATVKRGVVGAIGGFLKGRLVQAGIVMGTTIFGVGRLIGMPKARLASVDSGLSQIRESITLEISYAKTGKPQDALDRLDEYKDMVAEKEAQIQEQKLLTQITSANPEVTFPAETRIMKLNRAIDLAQRQIALYIASGEVAELDEAIDLLNTIFEDFEGEK